MAELPDDLRTAVEDQAKARVEMSIQGYAKYLKPEAVDSLRASFPGIPPRVSRYEIGPVGTAGGDYVVDVRYFVRDESFFVRSRWHPESGSWMVIHAERLWEEGEARPGIISRLLMSVIGRFTRRRGR
ncbi:MAG: hypothetical protein WD904_02310 [Dehalococcoidia bacterium]